MQAIVSNIGALVTPNITTALVAMNRVEGPANGIRPNPNDVSRTVINSIGTTFQNHPFALGLRKHHIVRG